MQTLNHARLRAWRAILSALAGGGLTVGAPVGAALGATATTPTPPASEGAATTTVTTTTGLSAEGSSKEAAGKEGASKEASGTQTGAGGSGQSSTTTTTATLPPPAPKQAPSEAKPTKGSAPTVVLQHKQRTTGKPHGSGSSKAGAKGKSSTPSAGKGSAANNVALPPALVAGQAEAIAAALASSAASAQALGFYRIPLFLLPIYKAAAVQYGVPWQILAAINEIETDYGSDLSVSTAGAVGWMQFMPETWLQYGVDALNAGYADPYNPVDAIFAAARYLRAAGAAENLRAAIFSYNHSTEYVDSVLLRAKLISTYPKDVIATLTGLTDGRLPLTGGHVGWEPEAPASAPASASATANARPLGESPTAASGSGTPGSPTAAAKAAKPASRPLQLVGLTSEPSASVVAAQDGRVVALGSSRALGRFVVLRDVYGDEFTYAGLGSVAPRYPRPKAPRSPVTPPAVEAASSHDPAPAKAASAGHQPLTLQVKARVPANTAPATSGEAGEGPAAGVGKVRLFAHPGNPDARAAAVNAARLRRTSAGSWLPLRRGSVVQSGTVLGRVNAPLGAPSGRMRFAIRPAGDTSSIDPRPVLANWAQLDAALHPRGAKAQNALLGATASDVLLLSKSELERTVLADPGITLDPCTRQEIAAGRLDRRVLALLAFLSRSGLKPAARTTCPISATGPGQALAANTLDITAINGMTIAGHQGSGTITDLTIRTLLTLPAQFVPHSITSLMHYPGALATLASRSYWDRIRVAYEPPTPAVALKPAVAATRAPSTRAGVSAPSSLLAPTYVSSGQWEGLISRIAALPTPKVARTPSSAAVPDPKRH